MPEPNEPQEMQISTQPVPTTVSLGRAKNDDDPTEWIVAIFTTPVGTNVFYLDPGLADVVGQQLRDLAGAIKGSNIIPVRRSIGELGLRDLRGNGDKPKP